MITDITLENFKCFQKVSVSPKLVTVLIGPNGTGKSSVLQALCLLKQWEPFETMLTLEGNFVQLSPGEFLHQGIDAGNPQVGLSISGAWTVAEKAVESPVDFQSDFLFAPDGRTALKIANAGFNFRGERVNVVSPPRSGPLGGMLTVGEANAGFTEEVSGVHIAKMGGMCTPYVENRHHLDLVLSCPSALFAAMRFVPAVRGLGRRIYQLGYEIHDDILVTGGLSAQEDATVTTMAYSEPDMGSVSRLMERVTGVGVKAPVVPPQSVRPMSTTPFGETNLQAEGSGTNALLHLLFELVRARSGATVLIEEPEIHLHPGAQAELASVIAGEAKAANKQVIMTTHSEHIAGRLMIEVAEGNLSPDDIAIYSFEKDAHGNCSANEIEVSSSGQVAGGLRSFFQTDLDEMRRYVDALRAKA